MIQTVTITDWLPTMNANGSVGSAYARNRIKKQDMGTVWGSCKYAGWKRFEGKVRVTVILYFAVRRTRDDDNLRYRCKGVFDAVKDFCTDDNTDDMEQIVLAQPALIPGRRATEITMETLG